MRLSTRLSNVVLGFEAREHKAAIHAMAIECRELEAENERLQKLIEDAIPLVESSLNWFWTQDEIDSWIEEAKKGGDK